MEEVEAEPWRGREHSGADVCISSFGYSYEGKNPRAELVFTLVVQPITCIFAKKYCAVSELLLSAATVPSPQHRTV